MDETTNVFFLDYRSRDSSLASVSLHRAKRYPFVLSYGSSQIIQSIYFCCSSAILVCMLQLKCFNFLGVHITRLKNALFKAMKGEIAKSAGASPHTPSGDSQRPEPPVVLLDAQGRRFTRHACEI